MKYGLQMFSLRDETKVNAVETIRKVAEMGYENIEFCGSYGLSGKEMKALLDEVGLKGISAHVGFQCFPDHFAEEVEFQHAVGNTHIILPYYPFPDEESAKASVDAVGKMMEAFKREGFEFGYHNHAHEFKPLNDNGTCAMDYLKTIDGLKFQPDIFWVKTAGIDPLPYVRALKGRLMSIHMKEYRADGFNVELGQGILPWKEIMAAAEEGGAAAGIVEQEQYTLPVLDSVRVGADYLKKTFG